MSMADATSTTFDIQALRKNVLALPHSLRAILAEDLLKSLDEAEEAKAIDAAWAEEAERRYSEVKSNRVKCIPGREVLRRVRHRNK